MPTFTQPLHGGDSGPGFHGDSATTVSYRGNGLAKASMILGILGLLTSFLFCPAIFFCLAGLVLGTAGLSRVRKEPGVFGGKNQAIAGITCSSVGLVAMLVLGYLVVKDGDPNPSAPSRSLREAAVLSVSSSSDQTATGNTPKAVELAEKYSIAMNGMHQSFFKSSKREGSVSNFV
jgi:hypothetical protein